MHTTFGHALFSEFPGATIAQGAQVIRALGAAALQFGDCVFWSASGGSVNKSTTANDYLLLAGIVVGGDVTNMRTLEYSAAPGSQAVVCSAAGKPVLLAISGIAWVYCSAAVTAPVRLGPPTTTAGQLVTYTVGTIIGSALVTIAGAGYTKIAIGRS